MKYRCEITGINESKWSCNGLTYNTIPEAEDYLNRLSLRWFGYDMSRIVPEDTAKNELLDKNDPLIFQNYRK